MKHILIIGGTSGIGLQLATQMQAANYTIYLTGRGPQPPAGFNPSQYQTYNTLDTDFTTDFLPETLHGIVYCPGSISLKPFARIKPEDFVADFNLNVVGAIKIIQACLPKLKAGANGSIVLFSTVAAQLGLNFHTQVATSKGALEGLSKALAAELAPNIRVNCIAPSLTNTPLAAQLLSTPEKTEANALRHPLKKIGTPADMANLAEFLLSDKSAWITGQVIHADGGLSTIKL